MAVVVSKVDALVEMVKAYDKQEIKRANKIGNILNKSMQKDTNENVYNAYIGLDKESKQLFPIKVRQSKKKVKTNNGKSSMEIKVGDKIYKIEVDEETISIKEKWTWMLRVTNVFGSILALKILHDTNTRVFFREYG